MALVNSFSWYFNNMNQLSVTRTRWTAQSFLEPEVRVAMAFVISQCAENYGGNLSWKINVNGIREPITINEICGTELGICSGNKTYERTRAPVPCSVL